MWLTKGDLDVARRVVWIRAKVFAEGRPAVGPQGRRPRWFPLSAPALAIAVKMLKASEKGRWLFAAPPAPGCRGDDRLRASRVVGDAQSGQEGRRAVKRGTLHSYRHFLVSTMANANVSPFKVMKIVGHQAAWTSS